MGGKRARLAIYALAGVYLLYMAWNLLQNLAAAGSEKTVMVIFMIFFFLVGGTMLGAGIWQMVKKK